MPGLVAAGLPIGDARCVLGECFRLSGDRPASLLPTDVRGELAAQKDQLAVQQKQLAAQQEQLDQLSALKAWVGPQQPEVARVAIG